MLSKWTISFICIFRPSPPWGSLSLVGWTRAHRAAEVKEAALRQKWCKAAMASWFPYLEVSIPVNDEPFEIPMWNNWIWCKGKKEPTTVLIQCQFYDWPIPEGMMPEIMIKSTMPYWQERKANLPVTLKLVSLGIKLREIDLDLTDIHMHLHV